MKSRNFLFSLVAFVLIAGSASAQSMDQGIQDLRYQKFKSAKDFFGQLIASKPDEKAYYYLGLADLGLGNKDEARADFQKGLQLNPKSPLNLVGLGRLDILDGKYDAAKQQFQQAFDFSEGRDFEVGEAILDASAQSSKADNAYAISLMTQIKQNRRNRRKEYTPEDFIALGDAQGELPGGAGDASANYENAVNVDPKNAVAYDKLGELLYGARAYNNALDNYHKAVAADPDYPVVYYHLYQYYIDHYEVGKAQANIQKYIALSDDKINAQVNLVDLYYYQGNYAAAINLADSIKSQVNPQTRTRLFKLKAVSENAMGDSLGAKQDMDTYFQQTPEDKRIPFDYQLYGNILTKLQQDSLANVYYAKSIAIDTTTNLDALRDFAERLRKALNFRGAALYYKKILNLAGPQAMVNDYFWYGISYYYANQMDSAAKIFQEMSQKFPAKADQIASSYYWGLSEAALDSSSTQGEQGYAVVPFLKYLTLIDPSDPTKKSQLTTIYTYLGAYYLNKGDMTNAGLFADKMAPFNPQTASQIYSSIAYSYLHQKDRNNATAFAHKALALNSGDQTAQQILSYYQKVDAYNAQKKAQKQKSN